MWCALKTLLSGMALLSASLVQAVDSTSAWTRWEQTLTSERAHPNPWREVTLRVTFTGPDGESFSGDGFWDGGQTFKVRTAFPSPGKWTWRTTCSDPSDAGLHGRTGQVTVVAYAGDNPLHRHGFLRVSDNHRHLAHADGTPFFWLGDTAWAAFYQATPANWELFLDDRVARQFTVLQVHAANGWTKKAVPADSEGHPPFEGKGESFRWNPAYWQGVERKVQAANDRGQVVFLCALIEPPWRLGGAERGDLDTVKIFTRQLAARLAGNFVVWSPVADDIPSAAADECGRALKEASPRQLVIAHPRFLLEAGVEFHDKDYTDAAGLQPGTGWTFNPYAKEKRKLFSAALAAEAAIEWPLALSRRAPVKPVLNLEGVYDRRGWQDIGKEYEEGPAIVERLPRGSGYLSFLSGACGYTYGTGGIWNWGAPLPWKKRDAAAPITSATQALQTAMRNPSTDDMRRMHDFFAAIEWWQLEPHHELIRNQPAEWVRRMVFARSPAGELAVAYLPDNPAIELESSALPAPCHARWFHPVEGRYQPADGADGPAGTRVFTRPTGWNDALLLLTATDIK